MNNEDLLGQCTAYFKSNRSFHRVFEKIKEKYQSLGKIGGSIVLTDLSEAEKEALTGFLRKDYTGQKSAVIKLERFEKALETTRFGELCLEEILKSYFGQAEMISNKEAKTLFIEERDRFFEQIVNDFKDTAAGGWLRDVIGHGGNAYGVLTKRYNADRDRLQKDIDAIARAFNALPCLTGEKEPLALFASQISKNPHAFDDGTECGQLLQYAVMYRFNHPKPQNAEEKAELYYRAGLLVDEVSNYTLCCGLKGYKEQQIHPGWEGFYISREPMQVSLRNLSLLNRVVSPEGKVFVFENPAVFSAMMDRFPHRCLPLVCTYGQVKLASLVLLDMLAKEGTAIYYSGDFDPEGLLIADKLKKRYGSRLLLWRYGAGDYALACSNQKIDRKRIKKLEKLKDEPLRQVGKCIEKQGAAGYQELLTDVLEKDIDELLLSKG